MLVKQNIVAYCNLQLCLNSVMLPVAILVKLITKIVDLGLRSKGTREIYWS